jgi:hypothetical protein
MAIIRRVIYFMHPAEGLSPRQQGLRRTCYDLRQGLKVHLEWVTLLLTWQKCLRGEVRWLILKKTSKPARPYSGIAYLTLLTCLYLCSCDHLLEGEPWAKYLDGMSLRGWQISENAAGSSGAAKMSCFQGTYAAKVPSPRSHSNNTAIMTLSEVNGRKAQEDTR